MINSGSSANSPKSYQSMKGSFDQSSEKEVQNFGLRFKLIEKKNRRDSQEINAAVPADPTFEEENSSNSQFANSMSHSFGSSFYEFNSQ